MNHRIYIVICILYIGIECESYTDKDFYAIGTLSKYFHSSNIIFVENEGHFTLVKRCQEFLGVGYYYASFNTSVMEKIIGNDTEQKYLFQERTMIITKQKLNLTELMYEVLLPHYITWIIFGEDKMWETSFIPMSCNILFVNSESERIKVEKVYHIKRGTEAVRTTWFLEVPNTSNKFPLARQQSLKSEKINFRNATLDLHILYTQEVCRQDEGITLKKLNCIHQTLLIMMAARLNYSVNFVECQEKEHPYAYPNGTDSEIFIKIRDREVDISSVSHVVRRVQTRPFIDYVWPTFALKSMMYLKQSTLTGRWMSYLRPLEARVWWCILWSILVTGVFVKIFEKSLSNNLKFDLLFAYEVTMSIFTALQVFCNQAVVDLSTSYSVRLLYILKFFIVLIFFQAYCGYLVSSLTVIVSQFPFTNLKGFMENEQYRIMTLRKGFHRYYFGKVVLEDKNETLMLPENELPETVQEAVDKLCAEDYLTFTEFREDLLNFGTLSCKISELPTPMVLLYVGIGVHKKSPLKEYLKRELLHLHSTGIIRRIGHYLSTHSDFRGASTSDEYSVVSIVHVFSIFILLYIGIGISLIIFCLETLVKKTRKSSFAGKQKNRLSRERMISGYISTKTKFNPDLHVY